ncbi:flavin-containing monooxygenase [Corynebacterium glyciniphilum]|uniref:flavin-containing monooxygenase n=1 Tax=Corynebacterium glyciniphilum TaxID=1404244 RepID=UPI003DA0F314
MTTTTDSTNVTDATAVARDWLAAFGDAASSAASTGDATTLTDLFAPDGWWKDRLATRWDYTTVEGREKIAALLTGPDAVPDSLSFTDLTLDPTYLPVEVPGAWIQAIFTFSHARGTGSGVIRLISDGNTGDWKAFTFYAVLEVLTGHTPTTGPNRVKGVTHGGTRTQVNWADWRRSATDYADHDPQVVIIGAGHCGLEVAAELGQSGVDALLIERNARVGDNWRKRYHSLVMHDPVHSNHMPYLPFPTNWPTFTAKDKIGDWFEAYASVMELNVWTSTEFTGASYDEDAHRWTLTVAHDGKERTLHPAHIVLATGISGKPSAPCLPGKEKFDGEFLHSSAFRDGADFEGKKVVIVGASNSAHDIAHDLAEHGVDVTMVQRSSTQVAGSQNMIDVLFEGLYGEGMDVRHGDLLAGSLPLPVMFQLHRDAAFAEIQRRDADMIEGLKASGYNFNPIGVQELFHRRGGGYYIDVGAAQAIIDGRIRMKSGVEVADFGPHEVTFTDGSTMDADAVILATGYGNVRSVIGDLFGEEVRGKVTDIWGVGEDDEMRGVWRPTGQEGLWVMGGNMFLARQNARPLALQIVAAEDRNNDAAEGQRP